MFITHWLYVRHLRIDYPHTAFVHHIPSTPLCLLRLVWQALYGICAFIIVTLYSCIILFQCHYVYYVLHLCIILFQCRYVYYVLYVWHLRIDYRHSVFMHHIVSMPLRLLRLVWHLRIDYRHAAFMHHIVLLLTTLSG